MDKIVTVLGDISPGELGFCHSHEHLSINEGRPFQVNPALLIDDEARTARELAIFRRAGGRSIADAQPLGCGRDAAVLRRLARRTGVHIIASTGFHKMEFYAPDHWIHETPADRLADWFRLELKQGMFEGADRAAPLRRTDVRAGQVKAALDRGGFEGQKRLVVAAAAAVKATGAPLTVHIENGSDPLALADFLADMGVAPDKTAFCHMDRTVADLDAHKELCGRGVYMEYDTIGRDKYHDDLTEARIVSEMLDAGHGKRLLMGLDVTRRRMLSYGGQIGLGYIKERFIPLLLRRGLSPAQVDDVFIHNPARFFTIAGTE
jgi:phosphotriesterase-related protein